jgi:parvulin-like peptidyl-prolyl isomerase
MKRLNIACVIIILFLYSCSTVKKEVYETGTPEYELALLCSEKCPVLNPDKNIILAKADTFKIYASHVMKHLTRHKKKLFKEIDTYSLYDLKDLVNNSAHVLVSNKLLVASAINNGFEMSQAELEALLNTQYENHGGKAGFIKYLEGIGLDFIYAITSLKNRHEVKRYLDSMVEGKDRVTPEELEQAIKQDALVSFHHILLRTDSKNKKEKSETKKRLEDILTRARNGEDFKSLARLYSEEERSRKRGGTYLGAGRDFMIEPVSDSLFSVTPGQISDVIESVQGYHIVKVLERQKDKRPSTEIEESLKQKKRAQEIKNLVLQLETTEHVEYFTI